MIKNAERHKFTELEPEYQEVIRRAVTIYAQWLNQYDNGYIYTEEHFLDKETNEYGEVTALVVVDTESFDHRLLIEADVDDGDEGGGTTLYTMCRRLPFSDAWAIGFIAQQFDVMFAPVYQGDPEHLFSNNDIVEHRRLT